jgi:hypothetical protein
MTTNPDDSTVLKRVSAWPVEDRIALAREVLSTGKQTSARVESRNTLNRTSGIAKESGPAPTDEEVRAWIDDPHVPVPTLAGLLSKLEA